MSIILWKEFAFQITADITLSVLVHYEHDIGSLAHVAAHDFADPPARHGVYFRCHGYRKIHPVPFPARSTAGARHGGVHRLRSGAVVHRAANDPRHAVVSSPPAYAAPAPAPLHWFHHAVRPSAADANRHQTVGGQSAAIPGRFHAFRFFRFLSGTCGAGVPNPPAGLAASGAYCGTAAGHGTGKHLSAFRPTSTNACSPPAGLGSDNAEDATAAPQLS